MSWASAIRKAVAQAFSPIPVIPRVIEWSKLVTLDFETYFDNDYTQNSTMGSCTKYQLTLK